MSSPSPPRFQRKRPERNIILQLVTGAILSYYIYLISEHLQTGNKFTTSSQAGIHPHEAFYASLCAICFAIVWLVYIYRYQAEIIAVQLGDDNGRLIMSDVIYVIFMVLISVQMYRDPLFAFPSLLALFVVHSAKTMELYTLYDLDSDIERIKWLRPFIFASRSINGTRTPQLEGMDEGKRALGRLASIWIRKGLIAPAQVVLLVLSILAGIFLLIWFAGRAVISIDLTAISWNHVYIINAGLLAGVTIYLIYKSLGPRNVITESENELDTIMQQLTGYTLKDRDDAAR